MPYKIVKIKTSGCFGTFHLSVAIMADTMRLFCSVIKVMNQPLNYALAALNQGASAGEMKRRIFQILCKVQRGLHLLRPNYTKERKKQEWGHSLAVWRHSATKTKWR